MANLENMNVTLDLLKKIQADNKPLAIIYMTKATTMSSIDRRDRPASGGAI